MVKVEHNYLIKFAYQNWVERRRYLQNQVQINLCIITAKAKFKHFIGVPKLFTPSLVNFVILTKFLEEKFIRNKDHDRKRERLFALKKIVLNKILTF